MFNGKLLVSHYHRVTNKHGDSTNTYAIIVRIMWELSMMDMKIRWMDKPAAAGNYRYL